MIRFFRNVLPAALALMFAAPLPAVAAVRLAAQGKALAQIVVADRPTRAAQFGALDLQWHLKKMTGAEFSVVPESRAAADGVKILVGPSKFTRTDIAALRPQECVVDVRSNAVELVGRDRADFAAVRFEAKANVIYWENKPGLYDEQGSMYAVYEFLERSLGVAWVDAYDYGTLIPEKPELSVKEGRQTFRPFMEYRGGTFEYGPSPVLWKSGSPERAEFNAIAFADAANATNSFQLFQTRHRAGGKFSPANHSFYWWYRRFWDEASPEFERKWPDAFAKGYEGKPPQLCFTNPEVIAQTVADIREYLERGGRPRPDRVEDDGISWGENRYCLEPMDNTKFCKCAQCVKFYEPERGDDNSSQSTYWFTFVKAVAEEIQKSHPQCTIATLAYYQHEGLPRNLKLPDNVEVYFCATGNREDPRGRLFAAQMARLKAWRAAYPKMKIGLWLYGCYPVEHAHIGGFQCLPGNFASEAARQYRLFKDLGVNAGVFQCGLDGEVCQFLAFRLMREPEADVEVLLSRYFSQYGAAARPMREMYDLIEERYCNGKYRPEGMSMRTAESFWEHRCPPEVMAQLEKLFSQAKQLADTPEAKARLAIFEAGQWRWIKAGADSWRRQKNAAPPQWRARRIGAAEGQIAKVDWAAIPEIAVGVYDCGADVLRPDVMKAGLKLAHDGKWLYMELVQQRDLEKLEISETIVPCDDWEIVASRRRALPFRCYFMNPSNRVIGASWGEVDGLYAVRSAETCGDRAYFARVESALIEPDRWVQRAAFPLEKFLDAPLAPGDTFYMMPLSVLNKAASGDPSRRFRIFSLVPFASLQKPDRSAAVHLER